MRTYSLKSGLVLFALTLFSVFYYSCTKEKITEEISNPQQTEQENFEKVATAPFITTSPKLGGKTFLFQRISECNAYTNLVTTSNGTIFYSSTQMGVEDINFQNFNFNLGEWVFVTPPVTSGTQPPVNKVLKFRYTSTSFNKNVTFSFNRNTGLWTIPTSNGTWEATQVNPSAPC
ncbi:MAG: hypothetical protein K1X54_01550 [Flavobacteriales bacterium]|nr:hypothetical protein [Flavobacteriales bacterium]